MDGAFPSQTGQPFDNIPNSGNGYGGRGRGGSSSGGRGFRGTSENAKTKLCNRWLAGECRFGDRCNFAHGEHELRKLPERPDSAGRGGYGAGGRGAGGRGQYSAGAPYGGGGRGAPIGGAPGGRGYGGGGGRMGGYGGGYGAPQGAYHGGYDAQPAGGYGQPAIDGEAAWAAQGCPVQGPNGWTKYRTKDSSEYYYHNHRTGVTQWDPPAEWPPGL